MNLDEMSWEERFRTALYALMIMETRALKAEAEISRLVYGISYKVDPRVMAKARKDYPDSHVHDRDARKPGPKTK